MTQDPKWNASGFVEYVIRRSGQKSDTAFPAVMRRADNPAQCSAAWEYLVPFCDLEDERQRLAFSLIGAAIAREKPEKDGSRGIGAVLKQICGADKDAVERESRRFRRLIGCDTVRELAAVLRPVLQYLQSKSAGSICYEQLLKDMLYWSEKVKIRWTCDFYGRTEDAPESGEKE